jgi:hypothetical protein
MTYTIAENLAAFLMEQCDSVLATWSGKLPKKQQLALFGVYFGKGLIVIDGTAETVSHIISTGFGLDCDRNGLMTFTACVTVLNGYVVELVANL